MKKSILLSCLFIVALLFPSVGHAEQSSQLTQVQENDLYITQMDSIELADGEDTETDVNDEQETPTETEEEEEEEETEFVLLPIFIILTVVIGIFVYNFTKNREN